MNVNPKVYAATVAAALSSLIVYFGEALLKVDWPGPVEAAILTLCVALATFLSGYLKTDEEPPRNPSLRA